MVDETQEPISENPRESAHQGGRLPAAKKGRGGKRPGAGAPKGNMNALKHGLRSKQFAQMGAIIARSPAAQIALLRFAQISQHEQMKADQAAENIVREVITRGLRRGEDRLRPGHERLIILPPVDDRRSTKDTFGSGVSTGPDAEHGPAEKSDVPAADNQTPDTPPTGNQPPDTKSH